MNRTCGLAIASLALLVAAAPGCATKGFVRTSIADVSAKVDSLTQSVEETQERTKTNEGRINDVDRKTGAAQTTADRAQQAAAQAGATATRADEQATALDRSSRRLIYMVVLSEDAGNFAFDKAALPDEAKASIDELITQLKADPKPVFFEIEGHTDSTGPKAYNEQLGLERAEAVKRYLYEQHQVPLHKMNVISFGADKPVAPNDTRDGRAANRRVVIKVLS
ncbi:MAG: OmpA family protein [Acidobacteriota bacterium]